MNIFNSLGSNYNFRYALKSIAEMSGDRSEKKLKSFLESKYTGKVIFTYKGREALRLALKIINKPDKYTVGVCGYTCFAVYDAVMREGYDIQYLDIERDTLNFSLDTLMKAYEKNKNLKVVFVQNTLGMPCEIEEIAKFCHEKGIILLEDLAHSIGSQYGSGKEAGVFGDFVMFSFSQDKVIDSVSGGALIIRNPDFNSVNFVLPQISMTQKIKDSMYPFLSFLIRKTYRSGFGKLGHMMFKKLNILSKPMNYIGDEKIHSVSKDKSGQILRQFTNLENIIYHKRKIAKTYSKNLNKEIISEKIADRIDSSSNIRFPIFVDKRNDLIKYLKKSGVYISDIWYDAPIAPEKYLDKTNYTKYTCPNAEYISGKILNLPTHINISEKDAECISEEINKWLKLQ